MPDRKSPLHPSALTLNQVQPGKHYIQFNLAYGIAERGVFLGKPFAGHLLYTFPSLQVRVRTKRGHTKAVYLGDYGILPYRGLGWNDRNFTIDARKQHLLPRPDPTLAALDNAAFRDDLQHLDYLDYSDYTDW